MARISKRVERNNTVDIASKMSMYCVVLSIQLKSKYISQALLGFNVITEQNKPTNCKVSNILA